MEVYTTAKDIAREWCFAKIHLHHLELELYGHFVALDSLGFSEATAAAS